ncbi:5257_t:CDS:2 [Acaulospora morrowiae]|uniref:Vacuolar calcium ion transporter n=1 Tax=Acaulospora morrowiae TaxID=94023 RepID=A0A9N9N6B8_9GLOM|nr:5257_t:CDS:2 [Acaulospora morrowiae]
MSTTVKIVPVKPNQDYGSTSTRQDTSIPISEPNSENSFTREAHVETIGNFSLIRRVLFSTKLNILLIILPFGIASHYLRLDDTIIFSLNFLAIIPLAKLLELATEGVSRRVGQAFGGLLNATFGNAIELIVSIIALMHGELRIVQASLLGSIISNLLFVLGFCFVVGGRYHHIQEFEQTVAQTSSSLMALACIGLIIPAAFNGVINRVVGSYRSIAEIFPNSNDVFTSDQLKTHAEFYTDKTENDPSDDIPMSLKQSIFMLAFVTLFVTFSAEYLVDSLEGLVEYSGISKTFVGFILLPIVGNAAEHVTAVSAARKNKMDLSISVAIGSSMQIALFVTPFLVLFGWVIGQPMSLYFHTFETVLLFISVFITSYLIQDGKSNWLEGSMLLATYAIISVAFFLYPDVAGPLSDDELPLPLPSLQASIISP